MCGAVSAAAAAQPELLPDGRPVPRYCQRRGGESLDSRRAADVLEFAPNCTGWDT